jgi:hydrogenase maturation protease
MRILVAGIGNIFFGDDAFGVEAAQLLLAEPLPPQVHVEDFGIRSYDLAYAIMSGYETVIFLDATPRNLSPGTVSLIELERERVAEGEPEMVNAHSMNPVLVLRMVESLGGTLPRLYLIGCEPAVLETEELGLSEPVQAALPAAAGLARSFVQALLAGTEADFLARGATPTIEEKPGGLR